MEWKEWKSKESKGKGKHLTTLWERKQKRIHTDQFLLAIHGLEKTKEKTRKEQKPTPPPFFLTEEKRHKMKFAAFSQNMLQASMTVPRCRSLLLFTIGEEKQQPTRLQSNNAY